MSDARPFTSGRDQVISYPVTAAGIRTRVVESVGGVAPLVCLHGAGSRADRFVPAVPGLVDAGYHVFAIDSPGHGLADKGAGPDYTAAGFAAFFSAVLDELGLSGVTVAGTSLGAHVAAHMALTRPDLVSSVVLIGAIGLAPLPEENMTPREVLADASDAGVRRKLDLLVADPAMVTDAWVREESMINSSLGARESLTAVADFLLGPCNEDLVVDALADAGLADRVLLVWGEDDRWTPLSMGHAAHAALPGSRLEVMGGCGHAPYFEDPDRFAQIMAEWRRLPV
ncbi:alpha/beta fold hydrolase [Geodermatophilus sabuli]|uniref:Pimeloyl-ACP methyl ester carboxylesterase n=1 Tax=Geodermatophilus sabuli TaxID=1564158 RepID=A0A285EBB6_9ACTN|nr:alpha/beta hydrolase [Geodermatophilus sabuli]MBB3085302.1 2-hydroxy-6-oxonona-2,4-dienedioate hydrolase [Geodermatophilus sabuli]SNX96270.1 Pimeloyl-ACP methyl ester carboxylesterase [Geodermatophilus sabuli]